MAAHTSMSISYTDEIEIINMALTVLPKTTADRKSQQHKQHIYDYQRLSYE
jgi:hypothetical protein